MRETEIQSQIREYLEKRNFWVIRVQCGRVKGGRMHLAKTGTADLITWLPDGRIFAIETKTEEGKLSTEQKDFQGMVIMWGGVYLCARSLDDVIDKLREVG